MRKFIDADRLKEAIDKLYDTEIRPWLSGVSAKSAIYQYVFPAIEELQKEQPATAVGKVITNTDPKLLIVDSDEWQTVLGQFENGQRVRIIIVKED